MAIRLFVFLFLLLSVHVTHAVEFTEQKYAVYYGDFNGDGIGGDIYFHAKKQIVLLHGDIITPIVYKPEAGFAYYMGGTGVPEALNLSETDLVNYTEARRGTDYRLVDANKERARNNFQI